jgi:hypothetical protein
MAALAARSNGQEEPAPALLYLPKTGRLSLCSRGPPSSILPMCHHGAGAYLRVQKSSPMRFSQRPCIPGSLSRSRLLHSVARCRAERLRGGRLPPVRSSHSKMEELRVPPKVNRLPERVILDQGVSRSPGSNRLRRAGQLITKERPRTENPRIAWASRNRVGANSQNRGEERTESAHASS